MNGSISSTEANYRAEPRMVRLRHGRATAPTGDRGLVRSARSRGVGGSRAVPLPRVERFLAGKAQIMAMAEQRRVQRLVSVPVRM